MIRRLLVPALLAAVLPAAADGTQGPGEAQLREAVVLHGLALAEMENDNYLGAIEHLEKIRAILPDNLLPAVNLAICRLRIQDLDGALASIRRARRLAPDSPEVLFTLARILEERPEWEGEWREVVDHFAEVRPRDPRPLYLRATRLEREGRIAEAAPVWRQALERAPDNLVLILGLLRSAAAAGELEATAEALTAAEDRVGGFETPADGFAARIRDALARGDAAGMEVPAVILVNVLKPTELYQIQLDELAGKGRPSGPLFPQLDFDPPLPRSIQGGMDIDIAFQKGPGGELPAGPRLEPAREPGRDDFLIAGAGGVALVEVGGGEPPRARPLPVEVGAGAFLFRGDVDQDEVNDLAIADAAGVRLISGATGAARTLLDAGRARGVAALVPVDLDHDGDLDLFLPRSGAPDLLLRNGGEGGWSEQAEAMGIGGPDGDSTGAVTADFDDDGDLDLLVAHGEGPPALYLNRRSGPLADATAEFRLDAAAGVRGALATDLNGDGLTDLVLWGPESGSTWMNEGGYEFRKMPPAGDAPWSCAAAADLDNDGDEDLVACAGGEAPRLAFLRNRDGELAPEGVGLPGGRFSSVLPADLDGDGDLDLVAARDEGPPVLLRNEGGSRNHWLRLTLRGKNDSNAKNNTQGLFTKIEVRAGTAYQARLGNGGVNHLGLGSQRQAQVLRVVWTNGVSQTWRMVAADRTMDEKQVLKGSCPFLYVWNGTAFEFVTDVMWTSPLGMLRDDGSRASHLSARDFVKIPADALRPSGDTLWLQLTEELWETVYVDRSYLLALDHPAGVEMVVDETFRQPKPSPAPPVHWIGRRIQPTTAVDQGGNDVLERIRARDGRRVDDLPLTRYQGLTAGHHLDLTFAEVPAGERLRLLLWGWIFPTDTSINRALSQNAALSGYPPRLELRAGDGWRTLIPSIGVPNGKRKAMVVELTDRLPAGTVTLRIATNLQIYWDAAALAVGEPDVAPVATRLEPAGGNLHYRGYSRLFRESPTGPHLFDYGEVRTGPRFRDMTGAFTRYGDVTELLEAEDDRYVVMNAGDELTVLFAAEALPPVPDGWVRDWALYTDGWVKDADVNTAFSASVGPLPYHGMTAYPDRPRHRYPSDPEHLRYLTRYQTRWVTDEPFRDALKPGAAGDR